MASKFTSGVFGSNTPAWHGEGTVLPGRIAIIDAMRLAGQDWRVVGRPVYNEVGEEVPGWMRTVREDTGRTLGIVGERYQIIQNASLYHFLEPVVDAADEVIETAGVLAGGETVWALAALSKQSFFIGNSDDQIMPYVLVNVGHTGQDTFLAALTNVRVVCWNTLRLALNTCSAIVRIKHTTNAEEYIAKAHSLLGLVAKKQEGNKDLFNLMARTPVSYHQVKSFVSAMFPADEKGEVSKQTERQRQAVTWGFEMPKNNLPGTSGTAWSLWNAYTDYKEHSSPVHTGTSRLGKSWFGNGDDIRTDSLKWLASEVMYVTVK